MMLDSDEYAGVALCLGHFVSTMQWHDLSATVQHDAKRALVNFFAGALGAARHPDITTPATLEGPYGWARACGDALQTERLLADLGAQWEASKNTFKPYPCGNKGDGRAATAAARTRLMQERGPVRVRGKT
jgi:hypothetical protein